MAKGKSGKINTVMLFVLIFLGFMGVVMLGVAVFGASIVDQTFSSIDVQIGEANFTETYDDTLGIGINVFLNSADNYGLFLLLGMVLLMVGSSFVFREKQKVWIVLEFFILIGAFVLAVTIQRSYDLIINSSTELLNIYSIELINSSKFILNLPVIITVTWFLMIVMAYGMRRKTEGFSDIGA